MEDKGFDKPPFLPKVHTLGKNVFLGFKIVLAQNRALKGMQIPDELIDVLKKVN